MVKVVVWTFVSFSEFTGIFERFLDYETSSGFENLAEIFENFLSHSFYKGFSSFIILLKICPFYEIWKIFPVAHARADGQILDPWLMLANATSTHEYSWVLDF